MPNRPAVDYKQGCKSAVFAAPQEAGGVSADRNLIHWRRAVWVEAGKACVSTTFVCHAVRSKFVPTGIARVCVIRHNKNIKNDLAVRNNRRTFANAKFRASRDGGMVDTRDLKSLGQEWLCGFESRSRHAFRFFYKDLVCYA